MGTLSSVISKVQLAIREKNTQFFENADYISLANDAIEEFYDEMKGHYCKAIISSVTGTLSESTSTITISSKEGIVPYGVIADVTSTVPRYSDLYTDRFSYAETAGGLQFYNQGTQAIVAYYWNARPDALTAVGDSVPWDGVWDQALKWKLILATKGIRQYKLTEAAIFAEAAIEKALSRMVDKYGCFTYRLQGSLNV